MAHDQNAADQRVDDVQHEGELHLLLPDNRGKRIVFSVKSSHELHRLPDFKICVICGYNFLDFDPKPE